MNLKKKKRISEKCEYSYETFIPEQIMEYWVVRGRGFEEVTCLDTTPESTLIGVPDIGCLAYPLTIPCMYPFQLSPFFSSPKTILSLKLQLSVLVPCTILHLLLLFFQFSFLH